MKTQELNSDFPSQCEHDMEGLGTIWVELDGDKKIVQD